MGRWVGRGYGRMFAKRPTGSRASCRSASGSSHSARPIYHQTDPWATLPNWQLAYCLLEKEKYREGRAGFAKCKIETDPNQPTPPTHPPPRNGNPHHFHFPQLTHRSNHKETRNLQNKVPSFHSARIKLSSLLNCTPPLAITDPIAALTGLLWNNIDKLSNMVVDLEVDKMAYMVVDNGHGGWQGV